jgi:hypothetical protein
MDQGGFAARAALTYLKTLYGMHNQSDPVDAIVGAQVATAGASRGTTTPNTPISRMQLAAEGQKLYQVYGDAYTQSREYRALLRRVR